MNNEPEVHPAKEDADKLGLNLTQVARVSGINVRNLYNWKESKPKLFRTVLLGAFFISKFENFIDYFKNQEDTEDDR